MYPNSGSDTESPSSEDNLTPHLNTQGNDYDKARSQYHETMVSGRYTDTFQQLDSLLPLTFSNKVNSEMFKGSIKSSTKPKYLASVTESVDNLRTDALKILKKLPNGNFSMWSVMSKLDLNEIRSLCKFCGVKVVGKATKSELGEIVVEQFAKGSFKSLFKNSNTRKVDDEGTKVTSVLPNINSTQTILSSQILTNYETYNVVPAISSSDAAIWKPIDGGKITNTKFIEEVVLEYFLVLIKFIFLYTSIIV